jgi:DNA-binding SARP family transcriptional activator/tetratricopeptide (TPR) repeat protein
MLHEINTLGRTGDLYGGHEVVQCQGRPEFVVLGPFEVRLGGERLDVGGPKQQSLLAALLLKAGQSVPVEELAEAIWGQYLPGYPRRAVQLYVTRLRGLLAGPTPDGVISTSATGYQLNIGRNQSDFGRFCRGLAQATRAADRGDLDGEAAALAAALGQWSGTPLAGVESELLQREVAPRLAEQRLWTMERRFDVEMRRGRHAELVSELVEVSAQNPLRESLWAQLITAMHRSGRRADALHAYHTVRQHLADELGVDPGEKLQSLYLEILRGTPVQDPRVTRMPVPRQLPPDVAAFAGRADELLQLDELITTRPDGARRALICVITGTAGIGKTALVAHWARGVADRFPDGQLWVNLRGYHAGNAATPGQVLTRFLRALGVPDAEIPLDLDDQVGLYRSLMDGRRALIVLDNAHSPEQVRPLLPGAPGCLVLVTSRNMLSGLVAVEDAHPLTLDLLSESEARQLLIRRLGSQRVEAAPVDDIIDLCARLPLALAIVAARAVAHPEFGLDTLVSELCAARGSLDAFADLGSGVDVRVVFSWSYRTLSREAARVFRLLGLHPGPDIAIAAVAGLAELSVPQARRLMRELADANLVTEHLPGRYALHDLLRAYAMELTRYSDSAGDRAEAQRRMLTYYVVTAPAGAGTLPPWEPITLLTLDAGLAIEDLHDHRQALAWFAAEHHVLLAVVEQAATQFPILAWQLAWTLTEYFYRQGHWRDWVTVLHIALDTAVRAGARAEEASSHRGLARVYARLGRVDAAVEHGRIAVRLSEKLGNLAALAMAHRALGFALEAAGHQHQALSHDLQALDLFRAVGQQDGVARALNTVGWSCARIGEFQRTLTYCELALTLATDLGDRQGQAATWDSLGYAHHHLGNHQRAIACYQHSLEICHDLDFRYKQAVVLTHIGDTYHATAQREHARTAWQAALEILTDLGHYKAPSIKARLQGAFEIGGPANTHSTIEE